MYGKIFQSIYDGTLVTNWKALVTFEQMIVLCDANGVLDMTPYALHRRTGIPQDIIEEGIRFLELPDAQSKSKVLDGRRIERLDAHRNWGWQIVNHEQYRDLVSAEDKKEADRVRIANKRAAARQAPVQGQMSLGVAGCRNVSQGVASVADVAHTDTDADAEEEKDIGPVDRLFRLWKTTYNHPRAKLDTKRGGKIRAALKLGYSVVELEHAIQGYKYSPHHMGKNEFGTVYDDIELFLRDAKHIDKGIQLWEARPKGTNGSDNPWDQGPSRGVLS